MLGLINPLRFAQGSRARAFGVGRDWFALFMVGASMLEPESELTPGDETSASDGRRD